MDKKGWNRQIGIFLIFVAIAISFAMLTYSYSGFNSINVANSTFQNSSFSAVKQMGIFDGVIRLLAFPVGIVFIVWIINLLKKSTGGGMV